MLSKKVNDAIVELTFNEYYPNRYFVGKHIDNDDMQRRLIMHLGNYILFAEKNKVSNLKKLRETLNVYNITLPPKIQRSIAELYLTDKNIKSYHINENILMDTFETDASTMHRVIITSNIVSPDNMAKIRKLIEGCRNENLLTVYNTRLRILKLFYLILDKKKNLLSNELVRIIMNNLK